MSSALIRQALELVDEEERGGKRALRRAEARRRRAGTGQEYKHSYKTKSKRTCKGESKTSEQVVEDNIQKLLALSTPVADSALAEKIVERAVKGKALLEKIEIKTKEERSILFPDEEPFKTFEKEYFCS